MKQSIELIQEGKKSFLPDNSITRTYLSEFFIEEDKLVTAAFGLVFCKDEVLFTKEGDVGHPDTDIPGGHIEKGETFEQALFREVFEETGVKTENFSLTGFAHHIVSNPPADYEYPTPDSYMLFYTGVIEEKKELNEHGIWITLDEARKTQWVNNNKKLFEAMVQRARYMRGEFTPTFLDVYNESAEKTGEIASYDRIHRQGLWHKGVHVWILTSDNKFLIQRRGPHVQTKPNMYECAAAGHIDYGFTRNQIVLKELEEELGLDAKGEQIVYVGTIVDQFTEERSAVINNEYDDIVLIRKDVDISLLRLAKEEVSSIELFDAKEFLEKGIKGEENFVFRPLEYKMLYAFLYE